MEIRNQQSRKKKIVNGLFRKGCIRFILILGSLDKEKEQRARNMFQCVTETSPHLENFAFCEGHASPLNTSKGPWCAGVFFLIQMNIDGSLVSRKVSSKLWGRH